MWVSCCSELAATVLLPSVGSAAVPPLVPDAGNGCLLSLFPSQSYKTYELINHFTIKLSFHWFFAAVLLFS